MADLAAADLEEVAQKCGLSYKVSLRSASSDPTCLLPTLQDQTSLELIKGGGVLDLECSAGQLLVGQPDALEPECPPYWQALVALRRVLLAQFSAFPLNGADLYEELKTSTAILSTGIGRFVCEPGQGGSRASC